MIKIGTRTSSTKIFPLILTCAALWQKVFTHKLTALSRGTHTVMDH